MNGKELEQFKKLIKHPSKLEDWQIELAHFVIDAELKGKLIRNCYTRIVYEPKEVAELLIQGRFVWGVVNWEMIDRC